MDRVEILPARGQLLVSTDLHGNREDFERLLEIFFEVRERARDPDSVHWALLGDLVHGPSRIAAQRSPQRFGYPDESARLVEALIDLRARFPTTVHLLLGNHDHGHIGGPHTRKFFDDEVVALERRMEPAAIEAMRHLFGQAALALAAPCGLLLCHGSPDQRLQSLQQLGGIDPRDPAALDVELHGVLHSLLTSYGQARDTTDQMLRQISRPGLDLRVVVHGHDVDLDGWYTEHDNQACPVLFGAPPGKRRYLLVDLAARYSSAQDLREGIEVRHLYPEAAPT